LGYSWPAIDRLWPQHVMPTDHIYMALGRTPRLLLLATKIRVNLASERSGKEGA
jgi:hypothetical protein